MTSRYTKHFFRPILDGNEQKRRIQIGKLLREAREEAGLTQAQVAPTLGYKFQSHISQIENGNRTFEPIELENFAHLYGKTLNDFATWLSTQPTTEELRQSVDVAVEKQMKQIARKKKQQHKQQMDLLARRLFEAQALKESGEKSEP